MIRRIRRLPSPALIVASVALVFAVAGGIGYAASKINGKNIRAQSIGAGKLKDHTLTGRQMKSKSIPGGKLKPNTVTGTQVKESTLGQVPSAAQADNATNANHATTADNANNANNANTVGGLHVVNFHQNGAGPLGAEQILNLNGLQLIASCNAGGAVTVTAQTTVNDGEISATATDASSGTVANNFDDSFNVGDNFAVPNPTDTDTIGQLAYTGGNLQTVRLFYNEEDSIGTNNCLFNGYAIG
jgi:hypothetical protein